MKQEYTPEEIANDPDFIKSMSIDSEGGGYWQDFASQSPEHFRMVQQAIDLYSVRNKTGKKADTSRIDSRKDQLIREIVHRDRIHKIKRTGIVVSFMALIALTSWLYYNQTTTIIPGTGIAGYETNEDREWITVQNPALTGTTSVGLPDDSYVFLDPGSSIRYHKTEFTNQREVHLKGSAFFMVEHNLNNRFVVFSNQFQTIVLGTEFYVSDPENRQESYVKVTDGQVRVRKQSRQDTSEDIAVLSKMESVHLDKRTKQILLKKENLNEATGVIALTQSMTYRNTPVSEIFKDLANKYNVTIHFEENVLKHCTLTATFKDKKLDQALYIICKILDASYQENQGQIEIYSKGCKK